MCEDQFLIQQKKAHPNQANIDTITAFFQTNVQIVYDNRAPYTEKLLMKAIILQEQVVERRGD